MQVFRIILSALAVAVSVGCVPQTPPPPPPEEIVDDDILGLAACPEDVSDLDRGVDLDPVASADGALMCALRSLDAALAERSILCLGEASHGVEESNTWRIPLVRYLVHAHGFRTIVLEATNASMLRADAYVHTGDPAEKEASFIDFAGSLGDSSSASAFLDMLLELQGELGADAPLHLRGLDIAVQPTQTRSALLAYLDDVAPGEVAMWNTALPRLSGNVDYRAAGDAAEELNAYFLANETAFVDATSDEAFEAALFDARNLRDGYWFLEYYFANEFYVGDATYREPGMVRNIETLREQTGEKMIILAHNTHCLRNRAIGVDVNGQSVPAFGTALATTHGEDYGVIGQLYLGGVESVPGWATQPYMTRNDSLEQAFTSLTDADVHLVSTSTARIDLERSWIFTGLEEVPADQFDALLWIRSVTATSVR